MELQMAKDLDYLTARLHGRRSRLAEGGRLDSLLRLKSAPDLGRTLFPEARIQDSPAAQRRMVRDLIVEMTGILHHLKGPEARLAEWMILRFHIANLKILLRGILSNTPARIAESHLIMLPADPVLEWAALLTKAKTPEDLTAMLPEEPLGRMLRGALATVPDRKEPFFIEAALDCAYFREGLVRAKALPSADRALITALVAAETDIFHMMLVLRGRFHYGLSPDLLEPFFAGKNRHTHLHFQAMMAAPDLTAAAKQMFGPVLDPPQPGAPEGSADPAALERRAWGRYRLLASRTFRQSRTHFGTIAGYIGLRRMETANLITLTEGIRCLVPEDSIRHRMIPPLHPEAPHV